jgi:Zn-dependent protease with chaperone function
MIGLAQAATGSLVAAVWQGMLLAAAAGLGLRLLPKTPAAVRFAIWFGVFLLVTALPVISLWPVARASGQGAWIVVDERWCVAIAAVWLVASLVRAGTLVAAALRVRALWKRATPVEIPTAGPSTAQAAGATCYAQDDNSYAGPSTAQAAGATCYAQDDNSYLTSTSRRAQICTSGEVDRPTVIGFFSPKILIPEWLLEKLSPAELEQVVLHERGHLGRADDWMNLVQKIALVVFPLNPALAWVERRLCFERELAVDERVLQATGAPKAYAACLATLAEYRLGRRALALALGALGRESHPSQQAGWGPRSELGRRVGRILRRGERMKPLHAKLVLGGAMLGLLVAATGFERCPQVVGFSNGSAQAVAQVGQQATAPGRSARLGVRTFRAVSVVYKTPEIREMQTMRHVTQEIQAGVSDSSPQQNAGAESGDKGSRLEDRRADDSARMVQVMATISHPTLPAPASKLPPQRTSSLGTAVLAGDPVRKSAKDGAPEVLGLARIASRTVSDEAPAQPANGMMQWVVVTTWQDGQATRMVFTTARVSNKAPMVEQDGAGPASEQVPSYAAVPVRGGWLVIQL